MDYIDRCLRTALEIMQVLLLQTMKNVFLIYKEHIYVFDKKESADCKSVQEKLVKRYHLLLFIDLLFNIIFNVFQL